MKYLKHAHTHTHTHTLNRLSWDWRHDWRPRVLNTLKVKNSITFITAFCPLHI